MVNKQDEVAELVDSGPAFDALGLVHRVRVPTGQAPHPTLVMVHGLQGNEDVTWIFARSAGSEWLIVSPRAPFKADEGYTWNTSDDYADPESYQAGLAALTRFVEGLPSRYPVDRARLVMLGFSQGAAMSYAFAALNRVLGLAALSGFMPRWVAEKHLTAFRGLPVLILHGTKDERVPISRAREDRDQLARAGAKVTYHEDEVGHKAGAAGLRLLSRWLAERLADRS
jgi:phospholipase/carboxylesterase